jgi:hypothetical protein
MALNTHPHLVSRLKKEQRYASIPALGYRGLFQGELFTFTFYKLIMILLWRETWFVTQKGGNRLSVFGKKVPKEAM